MNIILASGSPRRRELLEQAGYHFEVLVSQADENVDIADPVQMVEELAARKAYAVAADLSVRSGEYLVIGADTIVVYENKILGKPEDKEDAYRMMHMLSGQTHQVYTGVAFYRVQDGNVVLEQKIHERTDVVIRQMTENEIIYYVENSPEWKDKAGGYGIQTSFGARFIPAIHGDYYNVVGLPACRTGQEIERILHR